MDYDIEIDYMDMRDDGRVWALLDDARPGFVPIAGAYAIVGCEGARPSVAQILSVNVEGRIELRVLRGTVEQNRHLLSTASA